MLAFGRDVSLQNEKLLVALAEDPCSVPFPTYGLLFQEMPLEQRAVTDLFLYASFLN